MVLDEQISLVQLNTIRLISVQLSDEFLGTFFIIN